MIFFFMFFLLSLFFFTSGCVESGSRRTHEVYTKGAEYEDKNTSAGFPPFTDCL